jgi:GTPase Era involved in 16S rRNA processing
MSSQNIHQNLQAIHAWTQENVILSTAQKEQYAQWCNDLAIKLERASQSPLKIGLIGGTGVGKSTIINRLAGAEISVTHKKRPYTDKVIIYYFHNEMPQLTFDGFHMIHCKHERENIAHLILFDFPDYDSHISEHRKMVQDISKELDLIVWVASPEKYADQAMIQMMSNLLQSSKNYCFVLNKTDQLQTDEISQIIGHWHLLLRQAHILEVPIFALSALNDHDDTFLNFQQWLFKKRDEHELKEIKRANIENQIKHKAQQIRQEIDCEQIAHVIQDLNQQKKHLNTFKNMRQKDILELISSDAMSSIHQYLSRQSHFVWPVGIAFGLIGRLKQSSMDYPIAQSSPGKDELFLKTIDNAIAQIQRFPVFPDIKISLLETYRQFVDRYKDPNQIVPFLGSIGWMQSTYFWVKQWLVISIPLLLCIIYLSGMHQYESIESFGLFSLLGGCFQIIIKLFQSEGLIAMISLLIIEVFLCMQLASGWHKKLARKSEELFHTLSNHVCEQLMFTLYETMQPLINWEEQAQLDCEKLKELPTK